MSYDGTLGQKIYLISGNVVPPCSLQGTEAFHSPPFVAEFVNNYKQYSFINNSHSFIICRFVALFRVITFGQFLIMFQNFVQRNKN